MVKTLYKSLLHFPRALRKKQFVFIVSSMRSGSTLLKSLLANAPDVSHLPEIHFHRYGKRKAWRLKTLSPKRIIVLKKPSWAHERNYPTLPPVSNYKIIVLIRNPYDTLTSVYKMYKKLDPEFEDHWDFEKLLDDYWLPTYESIMAKDILESSNARLVRYEELVAQPVAITKDLFQFIGSTQDKGVDTYQKPEKYRWDWFNDDGGKMIQTMKVQLSQTERDNAVLEKLITESKRVRVVMRYFGYLEVLPAVHPD